MPSILESRFADIRYLLVGGLVASGFVEGRPCAPSGRPRWRAGERVGRGARPTRSPADGLFLRPVPDDEPLDQSVELARAAVNVYFISHFAQRPRSRPPGMPRSHAPVD